MIDKPYQVTPEALRQEANNLEYTGRQHYADIMRWAADIIEELEAAICKHQESFNLRDDEPTAVEYELWKALEKG
jgi:hypothetical protein